MQARIKKTTTRSPQAPLGPIEQIDRFKEAARELEVDESEAAFDWKLKALAGKKPAERSK